MKYFEKIAYDVQSFDVDLKTKQLSDRVDWTNRHPNMGSAYLLPKYKNKGGKVTWNISQSDKEEDANLDPKAVKGSGTLEEYQKVLKKTKWKKDLGSHGNVAVSIPTKSADIEDLKIGLAHNKKIKPGKFLGITYRKGLDLKKASEPEIRKFINK